jgi:hypothetical protein
MPVNKIRKAPFGALVSFLVPRRVRQFRWAEGCRVALSGDARFRGYHIR